MMLERVRFNDFDHAKAIAEAAGVPFNPLNDICISRVDAKGELMGGVLYNTYTGRGGSINLHYAGFHPRWFNRTMLFVCFDYPFNQLGVKKIFGQVPAKNAHAIRVNLHMGFRHELSEPIKDAYPDDDMVVLSMYRADCKYLGVFPEQEESDGR